MSLEEPNYQLKGWRAQDLAMRSPRWKRWLYRAAKPLLGLQSRGYLSAEARRRWGVTWTFLRRGFPLEARRVFGARGTRLSEATILVQGTGNGWDVVSWSELRPERIVAVDRWSFPDWEEVSRHCRDAHGVRVEFREAPLEDCGFLPERSVDLCVSDAVLEHVRTLDAAMRESKRVLRAGGHLYASIGPLWFSPGGDHFSPRGPLEDCYAHVDRDADAYRAFFESRKLPVEDFQSGGRYVELDLFSKLTTDEYLLSFRGAGLEVEELVAEVCPLALDFERRFPERMDALLRRHEGRITRDDLRTRGLMVRLRA